MFFNLPWSALNRCTDEHPLNGLIGVVINNANSTKEVRMQRIWDSVTLVNGTVKYCGSMENRMMVVPKIK